MLGLLRGVTSKKYEQIFSYFSTILLCLKNFF